MSEYPEELFEDDILPGEEEAFTEAELQDALARLEASNCPGDLLMGPSPQDVAAFLELRTLTHEASEAILSGAGLDFSLPATDQETPKRSNIIIRRRAEELIEEGEDPLDALELLED